MKLLALLVIIGSVFSTAQVSQFPYIQNFDSSYIVYPALPIGWISTQNRTPGTNDFITTTSNVNSLPNAVVSTNARISQSLITPIINFSGKLVDSLKFFERRTGTHDSDLLLEASTDGGLNYIIIIGDTLKNPGHTNYFQRKLKLPSSLDDLSYVKFRWRVVGNGTGSTGTIRFDDIYISTKTAIDIGITNTSYQPLFPIMGDSILLTATIKNFGMQTINNFIVNYYIDSNLDSVAQSNELFTSVNIDTTLQQFDTVRTSVLIPWIFLSELQIISRVNIQGDENPANNQNITRIIFGVKPFSIVINEIMYKPTAPEPEWIEIANNTNDSINLKNWKISDSKTTSKATITALNYFLKSGCYAVITKDTSSFFEVHPNTPGKVFIVPAIATFNNDSDAVVIFDQRGSIIDSVFYKSSWGGSSGGKSLERIEPLGQSNAKSNWGTSTNPTGCTPGKKNSLTPKEFDLTMKNIYFNPTAPISGDVVNINTVILNKGKQTAENFSIEIYFDQNRDTIPQAAELISQNIFYLPLLSGDSVLYTTNYHLTTIGNYSFIAKVIYLFDEDILNNQRYSTIYAGYVRWTIVINEIMFAPVSGEPEWVELFNISNDTVNLQNWKLGNRNTSSKYIITSSDLFLMPKDYVVFTKDTALFFEKRKNINASVIQSTSLPTFLFNNNGDAVVLFDQRNANIDSVNYTPGWGGTNGKSLERVEAEISSLDSTNWGSSPDSSGATPGRQNYLTPLGFNLQAVRIFSNRTLPGEPANIFAVIKNSGKNPASQFTVNLYNDLNSDSHPEETELITSYNYSGQLNYKDSTLINFVWNDPGYGIKNLLAVVDYPLDMRLRDNIVSGNIKICYPPKSLIINEIMFEPFTGKSEYIELYNRENFPVEMRYWKIHDTPDTAGKANEFKLGSTNIVVNPGEFLVLAADSSILQQFSYLATQENGYSLHIFKKSSLSLNNDGDDVVLKDLTGYIIDSVRYSPKWHNPEINDKRGRAIERINPNLPTNDSRNWSTCVNPIGGTPGKKNSVFAINVSASASLIFTPNPFSPDADGFEDHTVISYDLPATTSMVRIKIFDAKGRLIRTLVNNEPSGSSGQYVWDGMNDDRQKARIGIYVVLLEAFDVNGGNINTVKGVVVLASKL